jgi:ceramide glucosyltransferase
LIRVIEILLTGICASSIVFWLLSVAAAADLFRRRGRSGRLPDGGWPPVSILKPIRGLDPDSYENFSSFARQRYARFEILFGAEAAGDPGLEVARRIQRDFPGVPVKIVDRVEPLGENPKVNTLASLEREASHPLLLISDSDIRVRPGYLRAMVRRLSGKNVAMVTSLYSSRAQSWAGRLEALGTATEFQPGVLVARIVERVRFGLGTGILIRRDALGSIGGFRAIADYLADDYMLGSLCFRAGHRIELATAVAEHHLGSPTLSEWIGRQVRWNRGIRVSRRAGYFGLALTQGVAAAALLLLATGASAFGWLVFAATMAVRLASAWIVGARYLRDPTVRRFLWLVPLRDLAGTALWAIGLFGKQIRWRGQRFRLAKDGRLLPQDAP